MNTKLTLSLDDQVIAKAKQYAKIHKTSVSHLVENFLDEITSEKAIVLTGTVAELAGIIPELPNDRSEYLEKKYS